MGEYAIRKIDGERVKIGTCEEMYYLRYEDRNKVTALEGNVDPIRDSKELRFRLPFPDEDSIPPGGDYELYERGERLYTQEPGGYCISATGFDVGEPGRVQLTHPSGLLISVPCYHGEKLPDGGEDIKVAWNGKSWFYELVQVRETDTGVKPIVHCRHCGEKWRFTWAEVLPFIQDKRLLERLKPYIEYEKALGVISADVIV